MSEEKLGFVGKQVKDIYGTYIGRVVGIITEIEGEIETVSVDCGSGGLKQLPYEQLVIQGEYVFFIPKWRLEAQKLLRQKSLTLKRIKALQEIVAENDSMKDDAELVYLKYDKKLQELEESQKTIDAKLHSRIVELDAESSNEMKEETYQQIKVQTDELLEHIANEKTEIANVRTKLANQTLENISSLTSSVAADTSSASQDSTDATPAPEALAEAAPVIVAPGTESQTETIPVVTAEQGENPTEPQNDTSWLNQVIQKQ